MSCRCAHITAWKSVTCACAECGALGRASRAWIDVDSLFSTMRNERRYKKFIGKVISKIATQIFEVVKKEARRLNLYTYEIEHGSKASKIFQAESFDFEDEDILHIELLTYFMSQGATGSNSTFLRNHLSALSFDPALEADYIKALRSDRNKLMVVGELEALYDEEVSDFAVRREIIQAATSEFIDCGMEDDQGAGEEFPNSSEGD
jgi:hypothetical protein